MVVYYDKICTYELEYSNNKSISKVPFHRNLKVRGERSVMRCHGWSIEFIDTAPTNLISCPIDLASYHNLTIRKLTIQNSSNNSRELSEYFSSFLAFNKAHSKKSFTPMPKLSSYRSSDPSPTAQKTLHRIRKLTIQNSSNDSRQLFWTLQWHRKAHPKKSFASMPKLSSYRSSDPRPTAQKTRHRNRNLTIWSSWKDSRQLFKKLQWHRKAHSKKSFASMPKT